jgi:hypothetical protein
MEQHKRKRLESIQFLAALLLFLGMCLVLARPAVMAGAFRALSPDAQPSLTIPTNIPASPNSTVDVPVVFDTGSFAVSGISFSIDYDQTYLNFDPTLPLSITFNVPSGFIATCQQDKTDTDGEIDCALYRPGFNPPVIPTSTVAVFRFRTLNVVGSVTTPVNFSANSPAPSFSDPQGYNVYGTVSNGSVVISSASTATFTPTSTYTHTPTPTSTHTPTPTPTNTFTPTPTGSHTPTPTPTGSHTPTPTSTSTPTHTPTPTVSVPPVNKPRMYAPLVVRPLICTDQIVNGGFEYNGNWEIPVTEWPAGYSWLRAYTGSFSMRTGILDWHDNRYSYSSARQLVTIPADASRVKLKFWEFSSSQEAPYGKVLSPEILEGPVAGQPLKFSPDQGDMQYVAILRPDNALLMIIWSQLSNAQTWTWRQVGMLNFVGQSVKIEFGTLNNNLTGGVTSMFVDDVSLEVCR